jgi:hypothetical protein
MVVRTQYGEGGLREEVLLSLCVRQDSVGIVKVKTGLLRRKILVFQS